MAGATVCMKYEEITVQISQAYIGNYELSFNKDSDLEIFITFSSIDAIQDFINSLLDQVAVAEEKERVRRAKLWKPSEDSIAETGV